MGSADLMKSTVRILAIFMLLSLRVAPPARAQEVEWKRLVHEAEFLHQQGRYSQAMASATQALRVAEDTFGPNHPAVARSLNSIAMLYYTQGQYAQAEPLFKRGLAIVKETLGPDHLGVAIGGSNLAALYVAQGQYSLAEPLIKRSLAIMEKSLGVDNPSVTTIQNNLAELYRTQGQYALAEVLYKRSLQVMEKTLGPNHPSVALILNNLAALYHTQGQFDLAEPLYKRGLDINEKALGPDHPSVANNLNNLAHLYDNRGQRELAEPLYKRSISIVEKALGPEHSSLARSLGNLSELYRKQGQYAKAEPFAKRSLALMEKALGPDHPDSALSLNNLAILYYGQGQFDLAEPLYKRGLAILEKALGPDHFEVANSLGNLSELYRKQGQYAKAEPFAKRSLEVKERALGPDHPAVALTVYNLAILYYAQGQYAQALTLARRASSIYRQRIVAGGTGDSAAREAFQNRAGFLGHLSLLFRNPHAEPAGKITDEAFQIVQLEQASGTASAIAKMASRFGSGDDALADLIKRKQDVSGRRGKAETRLVTASSKPPKERNANDEQRLRDDITLAGKEIEAIDSEVTRRFPEYQELTRPEPASVGQIRAILKQGEAMLVYALGDTSYLWVVTPDGAVFTPVQVKEKDVAEKVATIRTEMEFDGSDQFKRVSVGILHELYQHIFAPALPYLAGVKHLMIMPSGPLQSLPFGMLVASTPPEIKSDADYRQVDWLAKHYAFSVLPSVSSIQAFRQFAKAGISQEPFAGFGDPLIGGTGSTTRGKRTKMDVAAVFRNLAVKTGTQTGAPVTEVADVEAIRKAPRLPETADELRAMGKVLNTTPNSIWLQENATETKIKRLDLSKYRTIAFATHGVMAGEISGVGESGLILTPPREGSLEDDGYLSAGEIAKLKLNADWVVLSACNTAAADGTPGAEGLSGLAKAFFYAGARSLLVSHWPVASEATVPLTTGMLKEYEANPSQGKAEAHRKAMMALMTTPDHPEYAHPIFWAPFVVVGEGGAARR